MQNRIIFTESNAYDFIEKIIYLEKTLGKNANYKTLEISELSSYKNDYNKIAKHIADFVCCNGSFIVAVEKI